MRKEDVSVDYLNKSQWGDSEQIRVIKTTQAPKSKLKKSGEVTNTTEARKVVSKRTEKPSKERKRELIIKAKARVISNQAELAEIKKEVKKVAKAKRKPRVKKK